MRTGDNGEGSVVSALGERKARARREGNVSGERCGEARGGCSPFIGAGGGPGWLMPTLISLTPLKNVGLMRG
jgi:hypothetical protein